MLDDFLVPDRGHPRAVMETIGALHNMGYELIRLHGHLESLDTHKLRTLKLWNPNLWRCSGWFYRIYPAHADKKLVIESTIPWLDHPVITGDTPEEAAELLIEKYPEIFESGRGTDEAYTSWYRELLEITGPYGIADMRGNSGVFISDCPKLCTFTPYIRDELLIANRHLDERNGPRLLMETIGELHRLGYGKLKIYCYFKDGSGPWRDALFADIRLPSSMQDIKNSRLHIPLSADSCSDTPHDLAKKIIASNPRLLESALGCDETYVKWYANMLKLTAPDGVLDMEYSNRVTFRFCNLETLTPPFYL
jgi:hypothetical protein